MARGWNASALNLLENGGGSIVALLRLEFDTTLYLTDAVHPVEYGGNTYTSSDSIVEIDDVVETSEIRINNWGFTVAGTDQTWYSIILSSDIVDTPVTYYLAVVDANYAVVDAKEMFSGAVTDPGFKETDRQSRIKITCASLFADFERRAGRMANPTSQEMYYPGDGPFFEFAPVTNKVKWTIKESNG